MRLHVERHDRLAAPPELRGESSGAVRVDGDALPQLDGCLVVRDADEREAHEAKWVTGRTSHDEHEASRRAATRGAAAAEPELAPQDQPGRRPPRSRSVTAIGTSKSPLVEASEPDDDARA